MCAVIVHNKLLKIYARLAYVSFKLFCITRLRVMCDPAILVDHGLTEIGLIIWEYIYMLQQAVT